MNISTDLLKAHRVGVRDFKEHLSAKLLNETLIITDRGEPISVNLPYEDILELIDILDELSDPETVAAVREGRKAIAAGAKGVAVSRLVKKYRKAKK